MALPRKMLGYTGRLLAVDQTLVDALVDAALAALKEAGDRT